MPQGHNRHENKRDKRATRLMQIAKRNRECGVMLQDKPIPFLDWGISSDQISAIIKEITGQDEDAFQDAWVIVFEKGLSDPAEIRGVALQCKRKNAGKTIESKYKNISLDMPTIKGEPNSRTFHEIIPSPELLPSEPEYKRLGKPQGRAIRLDDETVKKLRERFGNLPLGRAIRSLVGLPPLENRTAWQVWEDKIIREVYSWGGSRGVIENGVNRSRGAVQGRAMLLGIKKGTYKPNGDWLVPKEIATIFHCSKTTVLEWCSKGFLKPITIKVKANSWHFFTQQELIRFMKEHPLIYPHDRMTDGFRQYIPNMVKDWLTIKEAGNVLHFHPVTIERAIRISRLKVIWGFYGRKFVNINDLKTYMDIPESKLETYMPNDYKVLFTGEKKHLIHQDSDGFWYRACNRGDRPAYNPEWIKFGFELKFAQGLPTCKICLAKLEATKCK